MQKSIILIAFLLGLVHEGYGATITKIFPAKKQVAIDIGTESGVGKKSKICFYEATTKVGCGVIKSVGPKSSTIRIKNAKIFPKLKEGMEARIETAAPSVAGEPATLPSPAKPSEGEPFLIPALFYGFPIINPINYSNLIYETPLGENVSSMWTADSRVKSTSAAFELGIGFGSMSLSLGLRGRFYSPKIIASDYDDVDSDSKKYFEKYAESVAIGSAFGAYADFYYLNYRWNFIGLKIGNGLDFDSSKVDFTMTQKDEFNSDEKNQLYRASSSLTAISLRTNLMLDFKFGLVGFRFGTVLYVPISQSSDFQMAADESPDPFLKFLTDIKPEDDLKKALEHQAKFAAELYVGANLNF